MKIKINKNILIKTLSHINSIVEKRNIISILANVKLEVLGNLLHLTSTDMDMAITEYIQVAVEKEGSISVSSQMLYDIIRKLDNNDVILELNEQIGRLRILSKNSEFHLPVISTEDFPNIDSNDFKNRFSVKSNKLRFLINKTKFSMADNETRYSLTGIYLHKEITNNENFLVAAATDGHRLSQAKILLNQEVDFFGVIVPKKAAQELSKLLEDTEDDVTIEYSNHKIKFIFNNIIFISKIIDATFPDYQNIIPKDNNKIMSIDRADFSKAVDRVSILLNDKYSGLKLILTKNCLTLLVNNEQHGEAKDVITMNYNDENLEISFNFRYISEILSAIDEDIVQLSFLESHSPTIIRSMSHQNLTYVLMPMRM